MRIVGDMLQYRMKHHLDRYEGVLAMLEDAFGDYETGKVSINGYLDAVIAIDQRVRRERPLWLHLCDWSLALRWLNSGERRAFRETCDALDWCRNWAIRQRGVDVTSCLERAGTSADHGLDQTLGLAA